MSPEARVRNAILSLMAGGVYFDTANLGSAKPLGIISRIGGNPVNFLGASKPSKRHVMYQINVFSESRLQADSIGRQVEDALVSQLKGYVEGGMESTYDDTTNLYGTRQDFSFWFDT
jgi:hypothetical protein